jgi:small-conductance mechanosensitive channel
MVVKRLFQIITLESAAVSVHRKRQFLLSLTLLIALLFFKLFSQSVIVGIPYAVQVFSVVLYTLITNITINIFRIFLVSGHRKRRNISTEEHDNFTVGINAMVNALTFFATIAFMFIVFQIEFKSFLSSIALFAVALTLILQDFIKNFLFGFAIMFSANYEIGDYIQVGNLPKGVIRNITFSNVQLKTESGDILYVPNSVVHSHEVINFSKLKPKRINTEFCLLRVQVSQIEVFEKALLTHLDQGYPNTFELDKCKVYVKENTKDEITFTLEAPTRKASLKLREQINHTVQKFAVEYVQ